MALQAAELTLQELAKQVGEAAAALGRGSAVDREAAAAEHKA